MLHVSLYRLIASQLSRGGSQGKLQIFIFHRVLDAPDPLMPGEPDIQRFDQIASLISQVFNVIPLSEAVERLKTHSLPARAACVTFDDGYLDNYSNALPILTKHAIPATVFIATDYMQGSMMWNDMVIESIRRFSGFLDVEEIDITKAPCENDQQRRDLLNQIIPTIKHLHPEKRADIVAKIVDKCRYQTERLMMTSQEVQAMRDAGITIGAHTCSHPILKSIDDVHARREIAESRDTLEALLGDKVNLFAYPNGRPSEDYSQRDVALVKQLGFEAAVSTSKQIASAKSDRYELPRFTPWDVNPQKFIGRSLFETFKLKS